MTAIAKQYAALHLIMVEQKNKRGNSTLDHLAFRAATWPTDAQVQAGIRAAAELDAKRGVRTVGRPK